MNSRYSLERRKRLCEPVAVDLAALVEPDMRWMFDLINPVSEKRAIALQRNADLVERQRATIARTNEIWSLASQSGRPSDPELLAARDQVNAEVHAIRSQLPRAKAAEFCRNGVRKGALKGARKDARKRAHDGETHQRLAPYAVLYLAWEAAYPQEWRAAGLHSPWHIKAKSLRQFAHLGVPPECAKPLSDLVIDAIRREHRCEDRWYAGVARRVAGPDLDQALTETLEAPDPVARMRAGYVRWIINSPAEPVTEVSWRRWLSCI